jgi:hypothetical protein
VDRIAEHDHESRPAHKDLGVRATRRRIVGRGIMRVAPQDEFFQHEEGKHPAEHGGHHAFDAAIRKSLG